MNTANTTNVKYCKHFNIGLLVVLVFIGSIYGISALTANAQTMSNQNYILQTEKINTNPDIADTASGKRQAASGKSTTEGVNYRVKTGFENAPTDTAFTVSLSSDIIDYGILSPTNPIIRTADLTVSDPPAHGYSVIASENHGLENIQPLSVKTAIPDATCDNGKCNHETADEWINIMSFGFGYSQSLFPNSNFYKQFANASNSELPQLVTSGFSSQNIRIFYKVNVPPALEKGIYINTITYIAIPNF